MNFSLDTWTLNNSVLNETWLWFKIKKSGLCFPAPGRPDSAVVWPSSALTQAPAVPVASHGFPSYLHCFYGVAWCPSSELPRQYWASPNLLVSPREANTILDTELCSQNSKVMQPNILCPSIWAISEFSESCEIQLFTFFGWIRIKYMHTHTHT